MNIKVKLSELSALAPITARHLESRLKEVSPSKKQQAALQDAPVVQVEFAVRCWAGCEEECVRDRIVLCCSRCWAHIVNSETEAVLNFVKENYPN